MPTPVDKAAQEAESRARQEAGNDPQLTAGALDVMDDGAPEAPLAPQPKAVPEPERPAPPVKSQFDTKRADIVARFRTSRTEEADDARDDISDFARSGMPPEFEPPAPEPIIEEPVAEAPAPIEPAPRPQMVKVKVHGVEKEVPLEEAIGKAQIAYASENILEEVKALKRELEADRRGNQQPPRAGQPDQHQIRPQAAQPEAQPPTDGDPAPNTTDADQLTKLIETLQFGDAHSAESRALLQNTIATEAMKVATQVVTNQLLNDRLRDEGARSQKVLADFLGQHEDIANDPNARAVIEYRIYEGQLADLKALGIDPTQIQTGHGGPPTPGDIAQAHRWYRAKGFNVKTSKEMLETATSEFVTWKGVKPNEPTADPARAAPRVDLTLDRQARRQAVPQQPTRTAAPRLNEQQAAPQARDRSSIVADMAARRGMPRGKVIA